MVRREHNNGISSVRVDTDKRQRTQPHYHRPEKSGSNTIKGIWHFKSANRHLWSTNQHFKSANWHNFSLLFWVYLSNFLLIQIRFLKIKFFNFVVADFLSWVNLIFKIKFIHFQLAQLQLILFVWLYVEFEYFLSNPYWAQPILVVKPGPD